MKKVVIKISGESLGLNSVDIVLNQLKIDISKFISNGYKIILISGGGNIIRGRSTINYDRVSADKAGMLATIINGLLLNSVLIKDGYKSKVFSTISIGNGIINEYNVDSIFKDDNDIAIISGGGGRIGFSTDILMVLAAIENRANYIIKKTNVDGVYSKDNKLYKSVKLTTLLTNDLYPIDGTAISLAKEHKLEIYMHHINKSSWDMIHSHEYGTYISDGSENLLHNSSNILS